MKIGGVVFEIFKRKDRVSDLYSFLHRITCTIFHSITCYTCTAFFDPHEFQQEIEKYLGKILEVFPASYPPVCESRCVLSPLLNLKAFGHLSHWYSLVVSCLERM